MNSNELYHYGVPGMHWGHRKATSSTSNNKRVKNKTNDTQPKKKRVSKKTKVVIGSAVAVAALAGIGAMLLSDTVADKARTVTIGKAMVDNMW